MFEKWEGRGDFPDGEDTARRNGENAERRPGHQSGAPFVFKITVQSLHFRMNELDFEIIQINLRCLCLSQRVTNDVSSSSCDP